MPRGVGRDHDLKRTSIRKGVAAYFSEHGFDRASMAGAAKACGVSKALIYHYYDNKESLLFDIVFAHLTDLVAAVEEVRKEDLKTLIGVILSAYENADAEHKLQLEALNILPQTKRIPLVDLQRTLIKEVSYAVATIAPTLENDRLHATTMSVFGILNWYYMWHRPGKGLSRNEYANLAADFIIGGIKNIR